MQLPTCTGTAPPPAAADFMVTESPATRSVTAGGATTYTVTVNGSGGFTGLVTSSVSA